MRISNGEQKRSIEFKDIYEGTVFICRSKTYIKGNGGAAVDLITGHISYPANGVPDEWSECYIYPKASLKLNE